ncbi:MAG TPA: hypothetical protein VLH19_02180 [Patescibacteria group bacterium]|nr:hypothetical protein [Patescibacteria group bacterium]
MLQDVFIGPRDAVEELQRVRRRVESVTIDPGEQRIIVSLVLSLIHFFRRGMQCATPLIENWYTLENRVGTDQARVLARRIRDEVL